MSTKLQDPKMICQQNSTQLLYKQQHSDFLGVGRHFGKPFAPPGVAAWVWPSGLPCGLETRRGRYKHMARKMLRSCTRADNLSVLSHSLSSWSWSPTKFAYTKELIQDSRDCFQKKKYARYKVHCWTCTGATAEETGVDALDRSSALSPETDHSGILQMSLQKTIYCKRGSAFLSDQLASLFLQSQDSLMKKSSRIWPEALFLGEAVRT